MTLSEGQQAVENPAPPPGLRSRLAAAAAWARRRHNILLFVGGFLFDVATLNRIDSWVDLSIQLAYLTALTLLLLGQHREAAGVWRPGGWAGKAWAWNVEALHFFYGGLLSNYVVFYAKSASGIKPLVFFGLLVLLMVTNEMPALRRIGHRLRLGLYAFCVASFLIYFVPVLLGRMGDAVFALSLALAAVVVWGVAGALSRTAPVEARRPYRRALAWPALAVLGFLGVLYALRLVPPVPLSVKFQGVYHSVVRADGVYLARAERPPFWLFWRKESRPFRLAPGDKPHYFARIFAPARFHHRVAIRWEEKDPATGKYEPRARVLVPISGGRDQGFRTFSFYTDIRPGRWRAGVETEDGRPVGRMSFDVVPVDPTRPRRWAERTM
jgi:hypothetical protein